MILLDLSRSALIAHLLYFLSLSVWNLLLFVSMVLQKVAHTHIQSHYIATEVKEENVNVRGERLWRAAAPQAHAWPSNEEQMCSEKCTHTAYVQNHSEYWNISSSEECNQLHNSSLWNVRCFLIYERALALSIRSSAFYWTYSSWDTAMC